MNLERIYSMKRQNAFTLAEVLITLGIIGVVAAMTMPSLLNATQGKQYVTAYKRALATMSQAGAMNYALSDEDFNTASNVYDVLKQRMNVVKDNNSGDGLYFNDGIYVGKITGGTDGTTTNTLKAAAGCKDPTTPGSETGTEAKCKIGLDVNGDKGPNKAGKDRYQVIFTRQGVIPGDDVGRNIVQKDKLVDAN